MLTDVIMQLITLVSCIAAVVFQLAIPSVCATAVIPPYVYDYGTFAAPVFVY